MKNSPDPKKPLDFKENLKLIHDKIQRLFAEKKLSPINTFHLQSNPSKSLCVTNPEMQYFWNVLFRKGKEEVENGLKFYIEHETNMYIL